MISTWSRPLLVPVILVVVALVACGGEDPDSATTSRATSTADTARATATSVVAATSAPTAVPTATAVPAPTATPTPAPTATPVLGVDLALNGSFEDGGADPENWTVFSRGPQSFQWLNTGARTGQRALKLTSEDTDASGPQISADLLLVLEKGKRYQLSAFVRTDQQVSFNFGMSWYEDDGVTRAGSQVKPFRDFVSSEWTQIIFTSDGSTFPLYEDPSIGRITLNIHSQPDVAPADAEEFTLYIDDISFREIVE